MVRVFGRLASVASVWTGCSLGVMACAAESVAQATGSLAGTVTIAATGEGFPGARVTMDGVGLTTFTDIDGRFGFPTVPVGTHRLVAEVVGCRAGSWTVEVAAGGVAALDITAAGPAFHGSGPYGAGSGTALSADPSTVDRLGPEDLRSDPARSVAEMIRGAFPGVKVVQGSGMPGEELSIQFRGPTSISRSEAPLVVVDGIITGGGLEGIDPRDIESITIIKGASGAAIYGARGSAGVIELATTRGVAEATTACFLTGQPSN